MLKTTEFHNIRKHLSEEKRELREAQFGRSNISTSAKLMWLSYNLSPPKYQQSCLLPFVTSVIRNHAVSVCIPVRWASVQPSRWMDGWMDGWTYGRYHQPPVLSLAQLMFLSPGSLSLGRGEGICQLVSIADSDEAEYNYTFTCPCVCPSKDVTSGGLSGGCLEGV